MKEYAGVGLECGMEAKGSSNLQISLQLKTSLKHS